MVNRETWYNDDYVLKYGALVEPAHESLAEATQLCAQECSSGRYLEDWELDAIMEYYWTLELKLEDLDLTNEEYESISRALNTDGDKARAIKLLKSKYLLASPATFVQDDPKGKAKQFTGNPQRGELIWELSCQTCHREFGPSQLILDQTKFTFRKFKRHFDKHTNFNLYHITRHGTYAEPGHRQYMPLYPLERLSHQQLADVEAFIINGTQ
jgi:mono/diheme cytochrome c family protein